MAMEADAAEQGQSDDRGVGIGWRVFQVVALLAAISYIAGWLWAGPMRYLEGLGAGGLESYTGIISLLSPIVSVFLIVLAVAPESLSWLTRAKTTGSRILLGFLLVLTVAWMVNAFFTPMYTKLITIPMDPSGVLPIPGGVFLHMVFQHWFQSIATIVLAVNPKGYSSLTESPTPAGLQCAVVDCR